MSDPLHERSQNSLLLGQNTRQFLRQTPIGAITDRQTADRIVLWHGSCGSRYSGEGILEDGSMAQGTIKTVRDDKGFGFIRPEDGGQDVFFHASSVQGTTFDQL